jgi:formylglycine-generating enzyme
MRHALELSILFVCVLAFTGCPGEDYQGYEEDKTVDPYTGDGDWVSISGGTFEMGLPDTGADDQLPSHTVTLPAFEMWRTEVTVAQYTECVAANGCDELAKGQTCNWDEDGRDDHPVNCIDWHEATAYCTWVGGRLPTESEWEYAARSQGQDIAYPWGDDRATCDFAILSDDHIVTDGCGEDSTWPVCSLTDGDTDQGLCDMAGNVVEWVQDWYHDDYVGAPDDGSAWDDPISTKRAARGGCYFSDPDDLRVSERYEYNPDIGGGPQGFRCAR